ncbi:hypothetical protein JCM10207_002668 [Rhodosporidiobolus poonsookiae]
MPAVAPGKTVDQQTAGGLTFAMMAEHDLSVDRNAWLRERQDDEVTVTTAMDLRTPGAGPGGAPGGGNDYFAARRAEYLKHGANMSRSSTPFDAGTPEELLPLELQRMPTATGGNDAFYNGGGTPNQSTENLIQYPPQYTSPSQRGSPQLGHRANFSQSSFSTLGGGAPAGYDLGAGGHPLEMAQFGAPGGPRSASRGGSPVQFHQHATSQGSLGGWRPQHQPNMSVQSRASSQDQFSSPRVPGSQPQSRPSSRTQQHPAAYPPPTGAGYAHAAQAFDRGMTRTPPAEEALRTPTQQMFGLAGAGAPNPYAPLNPDESQEDLTRRQ